MRACVGTRRRFTVDLISLLAAPSALSSLLAQPLGAETPKQPGDVSRDAEAIHQTLTFQATPARVYETLVDQSQFSAITKFSTVPNAASAQLSREPGTTFSLFDGHIVGRHVELIPARRVVQAWRAADWPEGLYSIVRFELANKGAQTLLIFDHTGFPKGAGEHLAQGWYANYWTPMKKLYG